MSNKKDAVYFKSLTIENVKCFRDRQMINFTNKNGEPAKWTVILGNNNTGKTTLLRALGDFENKSSHFWLLYNSSNFAVAELKILFRNTIFSLIFKKKGITYSMDIANDEEVKANFKIFAYGTNRKPSTQNNSNDKNNFTNNLYDNNSELINAEEWLKEIYLAAKNGAKKAENRLEKMKQVLKDILPDVNDFRFVTNEETFETNVEVQTDYGWMKMNDLGYGYQSLSTWVIDLAKKMFDRYPNAENPLHEPAIVLVDEIDLHLHPEWQRKIISYLSDNFPNTQFIVTSHSPLVVQSADEVNVILLKKEGDKVMIEQPEIENYQGWSVEEILQEVMDLDDRTHSQKYIELRQNFEDALDEHDYEKAKNAKDALEKILNPQSTQAKIMEIQMASLTAQFIENY